MSACEETCVATRTLQRSEPSDDARSVAPARRFKFGTEAMPPPGDDRSGLESIHETSVWAPLVTLYRDFFLGPVGPELRPGPSRRGPPRRGSPPRGASPRGRLRRGESDRALAGG